MEEVWASIPGLPEYAVSSLGKIKSLKRSDIGKVLSQRDDGRGYLYVSVTLSGKNATFKVHRAVALAFLGPRPEGLTINHKDGCKKNNRVENLEYATRSENMRHAYTHRLVGRFFAEDIEIMKQMRRDRYSVKEIAFAFRTTNSHICELTKGVKRNVPLVSVVRETHKDR